MVKLLSCLGQSIRFHAAGYGNDTGYAGKLARANPRRV